MKPTILASKRFEGYDFPVDGIRRLIEYGRNATLGESYHVFDSIYNHRSSELRSVRNTIDSIMNWLYANNDVPSDENTLLLTDVNAVTQETLRIHENDAAYKLYTVASRVVGFENSVLHPNKVGRIYKDIAKDTYKKYLFVSFDISSIRQTKKLVDGQLYRLFIIVEDTAHYIEFVHKDDIDVYMAFAPSDIPERLLTTSSYVVSAMDVTWSCKQPSVFQTEHLPSVVSEIPVEKDTMSVYDNFVMHLRQEIEDQKFISFFKKRLPGTVLNWIENTPKAKKEFFIAGGFLRDAYSAFVSGEEFHHNGVDIFFNDKKFAPKNINDTENTSFFKIKGEIDTKSIQEFISLFDFTANMIAFDGKRIIFPTGIRNSVTNSIASKVLLASPNHKFFLKQVPPNERLEWLARSGYTIPHAEYCKYIATLNQISTTLNLV